MAAINTSILKVYDDIIKSETDSRSYRGLELCNRMKILLISDVTTDISAAALDVRVGSMLDPPELLGLAHFCEHMLFLGTEKYPEENDYTKFVHQHGGSSNAFTAADHACYHFDISPNHLKDALDRFSQFFLCPLFTESATEKEVNAVNSEHERNLQNDVWRLLQLEKATSNPNHDYYKFGTGNLETLNILPKSKGINIREELLKFHGTYYSSNIMALVVLGKEKLDELTDIVVPLFAQVRNKNVPLAEWKEHPFDQAFLKLKGYVVPVKDLRSMNITFPIPDLQQHYRSGPGNYLGHLIGHEGPGSLLSELKVRGWVNNLIGGYKPGAKGFAFLIVNVDLTEEGINHTNEIVTLLFQFLKMLKSERPQKWIFSECKDLAAMTFRFKDREKPQSYSCTLSDLLFNYPFEEVLCGCFILHEYRPDLIDELLNMLTPENIRIAVIGKKFEDMCTETEKWYGTKYRLEKIDDSILDLWKNVKLHPNLKLPAKNEFVPTNFELATRELEASNFPVLIRNTAMGRLWFKQDDEFQLPKAVLSFEIESPLAYIDPLHYNANHLFIALVRDSLNEYGYAAELAGLSYCLRNTKLGLFLNVSGYNDKQRVLLEKIMESITTLKIDGKRFEILKEEHIRGLKNFEAEQPHRQAVYYTSLLLSERIWTNDELLQCVDELTIDNVQQLIPRLLSKVHIEALIHGNLTREEALSMMDIVESYLIHNVNSKPLLPSQLVRDREIQLSEGCHYVYEVSNNVHNSSSVEVYYQCGTQDTRSNMLLQLFSELLSEPCFNFLRTQEQLGYVVSSGIRRSNGAQGMRILVQSDRHPSYVDGRIEAFIQYLDKCIMNMSDEEFQNYVHALSLLRKEKPKKLALQSAKYWMEIVSHQFNFDRDNIEVACLSTITKEEIYSFFKDLISHEAPKRKKLSVHVVSSTNSASETDHEEMFSCVPDEAGLIPPPPAFRPPLKIENIVQFKNSLALYPLVAPFIQIPLPFLNQERSKL